MLRFVASVFAHKLLLAEEIQEPISEVYAKLSQDKKIKKDEILMLEIAKENIYLSIPPEPNWGIKKEEKLAEAVIKRKKTYQAFAEAHNACLFTLGSYFKKPILKTLPLFSEESLPEAENLFLNMDPKYNILYLWDEKKEGKTREERLEEIGKDVLFDGQLTKTLMQYAHLPSLSAYQAAGIEEKRDEEKTANETAQSVYLHTARAMGQAQAMRLFSSEIKQSVLHYKEDRKDEKIAFFLQHRLDIILFLLQKCADLQVKNSAGHTPLLLATFAHHADMIVRFLQQRRNIGITEEAAHILSVKEQIFLQAVHSNQLAIVIFFLEQGITENAKKKALIIMARMHNVAMLRVFLHKGINPYEMLLIAARHNLISTLLFLLQQEVIAETQNRVFIDLANIQNTEPSISFFLQRNLPEEIKHQAFSIAVNKDYPRKVALFLQAEIAYAKKEEALYIASRHGHLEIAILLLQYNFPLVVKENSLLLLIEYRKRRIHDPATSLKIARSLLQHLIPGLEDEVFSDPPFKKHIRRAKDRKGRRIVPHARYVPIVKWILLLRTIQEEIDDAFVDAAYHGQLSIVAFLMQQKISQAIVEQAFSQAVRANQAPIISFLLQQGIVQTVKEKALLDAVFYNCPSTCLLLIEAGISLAVMEQTFINAAQLGRRIEVLQRLLQQNIRPEIKEKALINAASYCHLETLRLLLQQNISIEAQEKALIAAVRADHPAVVLFFLEQRPSLAAKEKALLTAVHHHKQGIIQLLRQEEITQSTRDKAWIAIAQYSRLPEGNIGIAGALLQELTPEIKDKTLTHIAKQDGCLLILIKYILKQPTSIAEKTKAWEEVVSQNRLSLFRFFLQISVTEKEKQLVRPITTSHNHQFFNTLLLETFFTPPLPEKEKEEEKEDVEEKRAAQDRMHVANLHATHSFRFFQHAGFRSSSTVPAPLSSLALKMDDIYARDANCVVKQIASPFTL